MAGVFQFISFVDLLSTGILSILYIEVRFASIGGVFYCYGGPFYWRGKVSMFEIENIMTKDVIAVKKDTAIQDTIRIMVENNITGLPVVNDKMQLVGVISEKDVMMLLYDVGSRAGKVQDFMTKNVVSFDREDSLAEVCDCLLKNHFRRVPIVAGPKKKLVGIISRKNIVQSISQYQDFFRDTPYIEDELADARAQVELLKSTSG